MRLRIQRTEHLAFDAPVREHHLEWRCAPWDDALQRLRGLELVCEPAATLASHRDCFGNQVHRMELLGPHEGLVLCMTAEVETLLEDPCAFEPVAPARERDWIDNALREAPRLWDLVLGHSASSPLLEALVSWTSPTDLGIDPASARGLSGLREGVPLFDQLQDASRWINAACSLRIEQDTEGQPPVEPAAPTGDTESPNLSGNAAALALLLLSVARGWGLPARLVSGYRHWEAAPDAGSDKQPAAAGLHHWAEVLVPGAGWRGFDPVLGGLADAGYVRLAVGRAAADLRPLRQSWKDDGTLGEQHCEIQVEAID